MTNPIHTFHHHRYRTPYFVAKIQVATATKALDAMKVLDKSINDLNALRGNIGVNQNRLSYAAANLSTTAENITATVKTPCHPQRGFCWRTENH
ncbi:MAG: flagellin [Syntrophus sp. (in: bacteria)]